MDKEFENFINDDYYKELTDKFKDLTPYESTLFPKIFYGCPYETKDMYVLYRVCGSYNKEDPDYMIFLYICEKLHRNLDGSAKIRQEALQELLSNNELVVDVKENSCRTKAGSYIGDIGYTWYLTHVMGLSNLESIDNNSEWTVSIGFNEKEQKWYGWSHRARHGFGIGDSTNIDLINLEYIDKTLAAKVETLDDAKQMAIAFAKSVN